MKILADLKENPEAFDTVHTDDLANPYISSSRIAAICGLNPHYTRLDVWLEMTGRKKQDPENVFMFWGKAVEGPIASLFAREKGGAVEPYQKIIQHPKLKYAIATPDYKYFRDEEYKEAGLYDIVECKSTGFFAKELWKEGAPDAAHCQLQWQLGIDDQAMEGYCAGLIGGNPADLKTPQFQRSSIIFGQLQRQAENFLELVLNDTPPDPTYRDTKEVERLIEIEDGKTIILESAEYGEMCKDLFHIGKLISKTNRQKKEYEEQTREIKNKLLLAAQGAQIAFVDEYQVTFKEVKRESYTVDPTSYVDVRIKMEYFREDEDGKK